MADDHRTLRPMPPAAAPTRTALPPTYQVVVAAGVIIAILAALVVAAVLALVSLRQDQLRFQDRNVPYAVAIANAALNAKGMANDERGYLISGDTEFLEEFDQRLINARTAFAEAAIAADGDVQHRAVTEAHQGFEDWVWAAREVFKTYQSGNRAKAMRTSLGPSRALRKEYEGQLADAQSVATTAIVLRRSSFAWSSWLMILVIGPVVAIAICFAVGLWLVRTLNAVGGARADVEVQPAAIRSPLDVRRRQG